MKITTKIVSCMVAILLLFSTMPIMTFADGNTENHINIVGDFKTNLVLSTDNDFLFKDVNILPGSEFATTISLTNTAPRKMDISLLEIKNNIEDDTLYNAMSLSIVVNGTEVYNGSYGNTASPVFDELTLKSGETVNMYVKSALADDYGNEMQNKNLDTTWTFEASYAGSDRSGGGNNGDTVTTSCKYFVKYLDTEGKELREQKTATASYNSTVTEKAPKIDGYTPDAAKKSITISLMNNTITFVYRKNSDTEATPMPTVIPTTAPTTIPSDGPVPTDLIPPVETDKSTDNITDDSGNDDNNNNNSGNDGGLNTTDGKNGETADGNIVTDSDGNVIGVVKDYEGKVFDENGNHIGYIYDGEIYDKDKNPLYVINPEKGALRDGAIYDENGERLCSVGDLVAIYDEDGNLLGYICGTTEKHYPIKTGYDDVTDDSTNIVTFMVILLVITIILCVILGAEVVLKKRKFGKEEKTSEKSKSEN